jgi:hypothetical protein
VRPAGVVGYHVFVQHASQFSGRLVFVDVNAIIFQSAEKSLRPGIVQALSLAIHGYLDAAFFNQLDVVQVGEVTSLVAVDDLRLPKGKSAFQAVQDE